MTILTHIIALSIGSFAGMFLMAALVVSRESNGELLDDLPDDLNPFKEDAK